MSDTFDTAIALLNSADEEKRLEGVRLLGTMKEARAAEALIGFFRRKETWAQSGRMPLERWWTLTDQPPLVEDLRRRNLRLLEEAACALVNIGRPAIPPLIAQVNSMSLMSMATFHGAIIGELFVWALGEIGDLEALSVLSRFKKPSGHLVDACVYAAAQEALKKIESAHKDILDKPIPTAAPPPSAESLPIPAKEPESPTEKLPRPVEGSDTD